MEALIVMVKNVLIFVAMAIPALLLVKTKLITSEQSGALSKLLLYVGMPFLVFSSTMNVSFTEGGTKWIFVAAIVSLAFSLFSVFLSKPASRMETDGKKQGMMRFCEIFSNNGFLGIPLTVAVFGESSPVVAYLIAVNIVTNTLMYTVGAVLISGDKGTMNVKKAVFNPVLIAFVLGLIASLCKVNTRLPAVASYASNFSNVVTPLSMSVLGIKLGDVKFSKLFAGWKVYYVSAWKLLIVPVLSVALCFALRLMFPLPDELILATFMAFAMPTASLASTFSDNYDGDTENAVSFTLGSTAMSVATIPLLYWLLCAIL